MKILVIEDDLGSRLLTKQMIEQLGHECIEADDGLSGMSVFELQQPDVVITDWMMPGMDGLDVCRRVRDADGDSYTYIVLLTALNSERHALSAIQAGADDYIAKPLDADELERRLVAAQRVVDTYSRLSAGTSEKAATAAAPSEPQEDVPYDPSALRVMNADDDQVARDLVSEMLAGEDEFQVVAKAKDTDEAVELARSKRPQVVILDWDMPGGGGVEAAAAIREHVPDARMIALSSSDSQEASFDMLRAGARDFLTKGVGRQQLIDSIRSAVRY